MKVAAIQMTSGPDVDANLRQAEELIQQAAAAGATYVQTPEDTDLIIENRIDHLDMHYIQERHPGVDLFSKLARELCIHVHAGSFIIRDAVEPKFHNRSFLFNPDGSLQITYDKIHLFDVDLPDGDIRRESNAVIAGDEAVLGKIGNVPLGMTICYDLRFSHLFRDMAKLGAAIISVPAAFTVPTGQAHWHILLRARAIETGAFIIASAQVGHHTPSRQTFGHSLIIDPWGTILAEAHKNEPCYILADLDLLSVERVRSSIPSLIHDREYLI